MMSSISSISFLVTLAALAATFTFQVVQSTPSRIVGGELSVPGDFPYFVDVGSGCGGALIAPDVVLFAAHCDTRKNHQVIVGSYEKGSLEYNEKGSAKTYTAEERFCETWVPHPDYSGRNKNNDFALCRLNEAVLLDTTTTRLELNFDSSMPQANDDLIVMGTGILDENKEKGTTLLRDVTVPYIPNNECKTMYGSSTITEKMLCAGFEEGEKDACQGDSGGPIVKRVLQADNTFVDYHVGVVSFGAGCARANKPGVYARTSAAKSWIEDTLRAWSENPPVSSESRCDGDNNDIQIDVSVTTDIYGSETQWSIRERGSDSSGSSDDNDVDDAIFARKYTLSHYVNDHKVCLSRNKCYTFEILDDYGDGLCYDRNDCGIYQAHELSGKRMFVSASFRGKSEQKHFCIDRNGERVDQLPPPPPETETPPQQKNTRKGKKKRKRKRRKPRKKKRRNKNKNNEATTDRLT